MKKVSRNYLTEKEKQILLVLETQPLHINEIAKKIDSASTNVVEMLRILLHKNFVTKERDKVIRTRMIISLTDKGRKYVDLIHKERILLLNLPDLLGDDE